MSYLLNLNDEPGWNYSDSSKPQYMPSITGTVVSVEEVQSTNYATKDKEFWPDGNPKLNIKLVIQGKSGRELPWVFSPKSLACDSVKNALKQYNPNAQTIADVGGLMVKITTWGDSNQYHANNPRPWQFEILGQGEAPFRGVKEFDSNPPVQQPQQTQQQVPPSPLNRNMNQQQQPMQQPMQQPVYPNDWPQSTPVTMQQPAQQQPAQQQPVQQQSPVVSVDTSVYDEDIPF